MVDEAGLRQTRRGAGLEPNERGKEAALNYWCFVYLTLPVHSVYTLSQLYNDTIAYRDDDASSFLYSNFGG
jgi:hypothetical protein